MIKIYPSALGNGEPVETHEIKEKTTIANWLSENVKGFSLQIEEHPIVVIVNDQPISSHLWDVVEINSNSNVIILPSPKGVVLAIVAVIAIASLAVAVYAMHQAKKNQPKERATGSSLDGADITSNIARWGDPIPEISGAPLVYPAMLTPQHKWYETDNDYNATEYSEMLLCVGVGEYQVASADVRIGDTPASLLGDSVQIEFFAPNEVIPSKYSTWWHTVQEVGFTTFGGSGMTLGTSSNIPLIWPGGHSRISATGIRGNAPPVQWEVGMKIRYLKIDHYVTFGSNYVSSALLDNAGLSISDVIDVGDEFYTINNIQPASGGTAGNVASILASDEPSRYDFDVTPITFRVTLSGIGYNITLNSAFSDISGVATAIENQLNGTPLQALVQSNRILIRQQGSPNGASIAITSDYTAVFGETPVITQGQSAQAGHDARYYLSGASFIPGTVMTNADKRGVVYEITNISGFDIDIRPVGNLIWGGMPPESKLPYVIHLHPDSFQVGWSGPFMASPKGEKVNRLEIDIFFPQGLIQYDKKNNPLAMTAGGVIQYRSGTLGAWTSYNFSKTATTPNQIGYTFAIDVADGEYQVRVRSNSEPSQSTQISDTMQWTGLKSRVVFSKNKYAGMTTMGIRMKSGDKISGGVENKISVRARRKLPPIAGGAPVATRDIAPFFKYMMQSVGYEPYLDSTLLNQLNTKWAGKYFDLEVSSSTTLKSLSNSLLLAGDAELTIRNGMITPVINERRDGMPTRIFSSADFVNPISQTISTIRPDDPDGIEAEFVEFESGKKETVSYLMPTDAGFRKEKTSVIGITDRLRAQRVIRLQRRMSALERVIFEFQTELQGMALQYGDKIGIQDGSVEYGQSTFALRKTQTKLFLTDDIKYDAAILHVGVRRKDGTLNYLGTATTDVSRKVLIFASGVPSDIVDITESVNPSVIYVGETQQFYYEALVTEVRPNSDNTVTVRAKGYVPEVYQ